MADGAVNILTPEVKAAFDKYQSTVEAFKGSNDERLAGIEKKFDDVVKRDETDKINAALNELKEDINKQILELKRADRQGGDDDDYELDVKYGQLVREEVKALDMFVRGGQHAGHVAVRNLRDQCKALGFDEKKDLSTVIMEDGGIAVRPEWEAEMIEIVNEISDMRQICGVIESGTAEKKILVNRGGAVAAWTTELAERNKTATAQLEERSLVANELYALNFITETMKEDAVFDILSWMTEEATEAIARAEGLAIISGDGVKKPKGILSQTLVADASWAWGSLGFLSTGASGAFAGSGLGADILFDAIHALPKKYRARADWVLNRLTLAAIRKLKDGDGNYVFKDSLTQQGFLSQLLGYPITEAEDMPDIAANAYAIAFGDFQRGYKIIDRIGMSVKRDDITEPQYDKVYMRRRVGGDVADYQAIKLIKFAA